MKEDLDYMESVFRQVSFPVTDLAIPGFPNIFIYQILGNLIIFNQIMDTGNTTSS